MIHEHPFASGLDIPQGNGNGSLNNIIGIAEILKKDYAYKIEFWYADYDTVWFTVPEDYSDIKIENLEEVLNYYTAICTRCVVVRENVKVEEIK